MEGISSEPRPYTLKSEKDEALRKKAKKIADKQGVDEEKVFQYLKERVTTWMIAPLKTVDSSHMTVGYLRSRETDDEGDEDWNEKKFEKVDETQFLKVVKVVLNYCFSPDNEKMHPDGFKKELKGDFLIRQVYEDISGNVASELVQAAAGDKLIDEDLINLDFRSILKSGETTERK